MSNIRAVALRLQRLTKVLSVTVDRLFYAVTIENLWQVFNHFGQVLRIGELEPHLAPSHADLM